ncbi:protein TRI1-like [Lycium barbarum]|uniref:protein TRI1-like n=1 Tax=Lycium barbarum TaxID=112863 RepID=UPI00293EE153|nr:protein TRI1-like [Lycium barbarum]XP_060207845.1 protein TRI1-like [Lycium barbarum]XP_060207846.1 protein TRI1-like [Lycium barbarum]
MDVYRTTPIRTRRDLYFGILSKTVNISRVLRSMASSTGILGNCCGVLRAAATKTATVTKRRGRPNGIVKPQAVSPALANFLGTNEASRTHAVKKVWEYIRSHNLQNPANKREIHCDDKLKTIFDGKDKVGFLEIARLLTQHFQKAA